MKTKLTDILAAIFLAPVALLFGLMLAVTFTPLAAFMCLILLVVLPFVMIDSAVCYAMGWPDWSKRQERKKASERAKHTGCDCSGVPVPAMDCCNIPALDCCNIPSLDCCNMPALDCCNMPALPDKLSATISPAAPPVCKACLARHQTDIPNARSLGNAWCHECGAEYEVLA